MPVTNVNGRQRLISSVSSGISATAIRTHIGSAVAHAQSMISPSLSQGVYRSLSQRECLRALSSWSATLQQNKQQKKEGEMKAFEFVLMNILKARTRALQKRMLHFKGLLK